MKDLLLGKETYAIIGLCMEVHRIIGHRFHEIVYKAVLVLEAHLNNIHIERAKEFKIECKQTILIHPFFADFVSFGGDNCGNQS